jgi:hypothetical protein
MALISYIEVFKHQWSPLVKRAFSFNTVRNNFRCGIGIFPLRAFSDTTSEIISNRESFFLSPAGITMIFHLIFFSKSTQISIKNHDWKINVKI